MQQVNSVLTDEEYAILIKECGRQQMISGKLVTPTGLVRNLLKSYINKLNNPEEVTHYPEESKQDNNQDSEQLGIPLNNQDSEHTAKQTQSKDVNPNFNWDF